MTASEANQSGSPESYTPKSVRLSPGMIAAIDELALMEDISFSHVVREALKTHLSGQQTSSAERPAPLAREWDIMVESGCYGRGYRLTVDYSLPAVDDADGTAYYIEDMVYNQLQELGGRDVTCETEAKGSMEGKHCQWRRPPVVPDKGLWLKDARTKVEGITFGSGIDVTIYRSPKLSSWQQAENECRGTTGIPYVRDTHAEFDHDVNAPCECIQDESNGWADCPRHGAYWRQKRGIS